MEVPLRPRTRALLILEFLVGAAPAIALYVFLLPVGLFWVRRVLELARDGTTNAFTTSFALIFVAGGAGLLSLCILFVGRLEQRKGLGYLLNACAKIKNSLHNSRLIIVGPGTMLRHRYEKLVEEMGLTDNVVFVGFVPSNELPSYYRSADIFCAPATGGESFGIILLEAMACGKPVVATNIQGYASVLANGEEGLLVPPRDEKSLADALLSLLNDKNLRLKMGAKGRTKAEKYSWPNISQQVMDYYNSLLNSCA